MIAHKVRFEKLHLTSSRLRRRLPLLLSLQGVYRSEPVISGLYVTDHCGRQVRLGKYLKAEGLSDANIQQAIIHLDESKPDLIFSCRFNDIMRMSDSPHFQSCMSPGGSKKKQIAIDLDNKSLAVAFTRDRAGGITNRVIVRAVVWGQQDTLLVQKQYGNGSANLFELLRKHLGSKVPVLRAAKDGDQIVTEKNIPLAKDVWIDESHTRRGRMREFKAIL